MATVIKYFGQQLMKFKDWILSLWTLKKKLFTKVKYVV